jgi:hypothetical protein
MSDMIDRLDALAGEVGGDAAERLSSAVVAARLAGEVRGEVRKRRAITAGLSLVIVAMAATAAVVLPNLMRSEPLEPASTVRVPVEAQDGLITYDDGSMKVLNQHGQTVNIPAPAADGPVFRAASIADACAVDARTLTQGWTTQFVDAFQVMTFGRPLLHDATGYHVLAQGQRVTLGSEWHASEFAFSVDADPAIAPYLVMTMTHYVLAPDGRVAYVGSQLESRPAIDYSGDKAAGTYTATLTTRGLRTFDECAGVSTSIDPAAASSLVHYMTVSVFLNDGHGHVAPIGTHTSWITMAKEGA